MRPSARLLVIPIAVGFFCIWTAESIPVLRFSLAIAYGYTCLEAVSPDQDEEEAQP